MRRACQVARPCQQCACCRLCSCLVRISLAHSVCLLPASQPVPQVGTLLLKPAAAGALHVPRRNKLLPPRCQLAHRRPRPLRPCCVTRGARAAAPSCRCPNASASRPRTTSPPLFATQPNPSPSFVCILAHPANHSSPRLLASLHLFSSHLVLNPDPLARAAPPPSPHIPAGQAALARQSAAAARMRAPPLPARLWRPCPAPVFPLLPSCMPPPASLRPAVRHVCPWLPPSRFSFHPPVLLS